MKKFLNDPIGIIFISVLSVFIVARLISYMVLVWPVLPPSTFLTISGFRLHHFVYGNLLIVGTSFYALALNKKPTKFLYYLYGVGLGLVLDEFPHWMGSLTELNRNVPIVPGGTVAVFIFLIILIGIYKKKLTK